MASNPIHFNCPRCSVGLVLPATNAGGVTRCFKCETLITVPTADDNEMSMELTDVSDLSILGQELQDFRPSKRRSPSKRRHSSHSPHRSKRYASDFDPFEQSQEVPVARPVEQASAPKPACAPSSRPARAPSGASSSAVAPVKSRSSSTAEHQVPVGASTSEGSNIEPRSSASSRKRKSSTKNRQQRHVKVKQVLINKETYDRLLLAAQEQREGKDRRFVNALCLFVFGVLIGVGILLGLIVPTSDVAGLRGVIEKFFPGTFIMQLADVVELESTAVDEEAVNADASAFELETDHTDTSSDVETDAETKTELDTIGE